MNDSSAATPSANNRDAPTEEPPGPCVDEIARLSAIAPDPFGGLGEFIEACEKESMLTLHAGVCGPGFWHESGL